MRHAFDVYYTLGISHRHYEIIVELLSLNVLIMLHIVSCDGAILVISP